MYQLPKLPYLYQDLEPYLTAHTIGLHYHKHHQNYLNKLNAILNKLNYNKPYTLNELPYHLNEFPLNVREDLLFNLGGVLNHNLYWKSMNSSIRKSPVGRLKQYIEKHFGTYENFWKLFKEKALSLKGSGYTFLVLTPNNTLEIINTKNQDLPQLLNYIPLFTVDMWEHAYYLTYENDKAKYLDNFEEIADFSYANELLNKI